MYSHPLVFASESINTGAAVVTTPTTAEVLVIASLLAIIVLLFLHIRIGFALCALVFLALLTASNAHADYPAGRAYYIVGFSATVRPSAVEICTYHVATNFAAGYSFVSATETVCNWKQPNNGPAGNSAISSFIGRCFYGGTMGANNICSGDPVCPVGQYHNGSICVPTNCGPLGTANPAGGCTCESSAYLASEGGGQTCRSCPAEGYVFGEAATVFSGQGEVPDVVCLQNLDAVGSSGCGRATARSTRQGTSFAAIATHWTGQSCVAPGGGPEIGEPDATPENANSPDDCLSAGLGFVSSAGGGTQCVQNGAPGTPVTTKKVTTGTTPNGAKSVTTTVTNNFGGNTTTTTTTTVTGGGTGPTPQTTSNTETDATTGEVGSGDANKGKCGAPGQPACRVETDPGPKEGDGDGSALDWGDTFNGEETTALLGQPKADFLAAARTALESMVMLPELPTGGGAVLSLWDGIEINLEPYAFHLRSILEWLFAIATLIHGYYEIRRYIEA